MRKNRRSCEFTEDRIHNLDVSKGIKVLSEGGDPCTSLNECKTQKERGGHGDASYSVMLLRDSGWLNSSFALVSQPPRTSYLVHVRYDGPVRLEENARGIHTRTIL